MFKKWKVEDFFMQYGLLDEDFQLLKRIPEEQKLSFGILLKFFQNYHRFPYRFEAWGTDWCRGAMARREQRTAAAMAMP